MKNINNKESFVVSYFKQIIYFTMCKYIIYFTIYLYIHKHTS